MKGLNITQANINKPTAVKNSNRYFCIVFVTPLNTYRLPYPRARLDDKSDELDW